MSASLKTLKLLQAAGLTGDALLEIVASINADCGEEPHPSLSAAVRRLAASPGMPRMSRRRRKGTPISEEKRNEVFRRDDYKCQYCPEDNPVLMTVDHVIARSKGGTNDMGNLKTACTACNGDKGDLSLEEWERKKSLACAPLPDRKPYTLRDLRRAKLAHDAPTVAEAERRRKLTVTKRSQYPKPTEEAIAEAHRIAHETVFADAKRRVANERRRTTKEGNLLSKDRLTDRQVVEGAQRALAAAGIE